MVTVGRIAQRKASYKQISVARLFNFGWLGKTGLIVCYGIRVLWLAMHAMSLSEVDWHNNNYYHHQLLLCCSFVFVICSFVVTSFVFVVIVVAYYYYSYDS